jgi:hypothetical protein
VKHLSDEDCLDFVRKVMPAPQRAAAERHLESECPECLRLCKFWENVCDVARRGLAGEVPPGLVRAGEVIFGDWRKRFILPAQARRARPIFDSMLEPLAAGVRGAAVPPRRVLHRWGKWIVDLRIESEPGDRLSVTGQMLNPGWRPEEGSNTVVILMSRDTIVAETRANEFGEFQFTSQQAPDLTMFIELPGQPPIAIALPDPNQPLSLKKKVRM